MANPVSNVFDDALRLLGVIDETATGNANQYAQMLRTLNNYMDSLSLDRGMIFSNTIETFNTAINTASYAIGSGATWNTVRPIDIDNAFVRVNAKDYPLDVITDRHYWQIANKLVSGDLTSDGTDAGGHAKLYYSDDNPNGTVYLWPRPNGVLAVYLISIKPLQTFALSSTDIALPPGYQHMMTYNLARLSQAAFGATLKQEDLKEAADALQRIRAQNVSFNPAGVSDPTKDRGTALDTRKGG